MNKNKLLIIGASGHGKVAADIGILNGYQAVAFLDDAPDVKECMGFPVLGDHTLAFRCCEEYDVFVAIGNSHIREKIFKELEGHSITPVTLIHPRAVVGMDVCIGEGSILMANTTVNSDTVIGKGNIINTNASVDHDNRIGDFGHISVGSHTAGGVQIGSHTWVGIGAVVKNNISICDNCMIGAGAVVVNNIEEAGTYIGIPARRSV